MADSEIFVSADEAGAAIRVLGKGSFSCSREIAAYGLEMVRRQVPRVIIDLAACTGMDSTFMGVLAQIASQGRVGGCMLAIANANQERREQLEELGVHRIVSFIDRDLSGLSWRVLEPADTSRLAQARTVLEAHEMLTEIDAANITRFKDVVEFIRKDIENLSE
jgi:anti-anti-sigma regulatory factor